MAGFVNGIATKESKLRDEFFTDESLHDPDGPNVMILGAVKPGMKWKRMSEAFRGFKTGIKI